MDLERLLADPPALHRNRGGRTVDWAVAGELLRELDRRLGADRRTLETGAGLSTLFFAIRGARHVAIAPDPDLMERVRRWCAEHGVDDGNLRLIAESSEQALPGLACEPLDLALIDGRHGFPAPFIDWYYIDGLLKIGGLLVVDDTQLWTGAMLRDFLRGDPAWEDQGEIGGKTALFVKRADGSGRREWSDQPFMVAASRRLQRNARFEAGWQHLKRGEWGTLYRKITEKRRR
jgi:predicted O-methyltransferase YrrM